MSETDPVQTMASRMKAVVDASTRKDLAACYIVWDFLALAKAAGVPDEAIDDTAVKLGIHPPDSGRRWFQAEKLLENECGQARGDQPLAIQRYIDWLYKMVAELEIDDDPSHRPVTSIADQVCAGHEGHSASDRLHKQADDAERSGEHRRAHELRQMAELAEDNEDVAFMTRLLV